jgi:hypothetical protein
VPFKTPSILRSTLRIFYFCPLTPPHFVANCASALFRRQVFGIRWKPLAQLLPSSLRYGGQESYGSMPPAEQGAMKRKRQTAVNAPAGIQVIPMNDL